MYFENEELFKHMVSEYGMNLFLGAGFSVYATNSEGCSLPLGNNINEQLIDYFGLSRDRKMDLSLICQKIKKDNRDSLNIFLREKYKVKDFDDTYLIINKLPVKNIFTINIDNLIEKIFEGRSSKFDISDVKINGYISKKNIINLYKIHGSVTHPIDYDMSFTEKELHDLFVKDKTLFETVSYKLLSSPCIFWGTRLYDSNTMQLLCNAETRNPIKMPKWIVVHPAKENDIYAEDYKDLGFNIIRADTKELIIYLGSMPFVNLEEDTRYIYRKYRDAFPSNFVCKELVKNSPVRPISDFFNGGEPQISDITSKNIIRTSYFNTILETILKNRIILITGIPGCGKSTLLLQLSFADEIKSRKFWFNSIIESEAHRIVKLTESDESVIVFLDNLYDNLSAFNVLKECSRIKIVTAERALNYEYVKRFLDIPINNIVDVSNLNLTDIQNICISMNRTSNEATDMIKDNDNISLLEIVFHIHKSITVKERISQYISDMNKYSDEYLKVSLLELFAVVNYTSYCGIAVSMDMLLFYFSSEIDSYEDILYALRKLNRIIVEINEIDGYYYEDNQDYVAIRSKLFAELSMFRLPKSVLNLVLNKFLDKVNPRIICRYDIFKKKAYDADITKRAFNKDEGISFYENILKINTNPYVRHQYALFLQRNDDLSNAWLQIDKAYTDCKSKIFTIANTHAIIMFEKNIIINAKNEKELVKLKEVISRTFETLEYCISKDLRVNYHILIYARHTIKYYDKFGLDNECLSYLDKSKNSLEVILSSNEYIYKKLLYELESLYKDVKRLLTLA